MMCTESAMEGGNITYLTIVLSLQYFTSWFFSILFTAAKCNDVVPNGEHSHIRTSIRAVDYRVTQSAILTVASPKPYPDVSVSP